MQNCYRTKLLIFTTLQVAMLFLAHGDLRIRCFSMQLVCLPMGFDHSKFQPRCISHHRRGAVRHTRRRHNVLNLVLHP